MFFFELRILRADLIEDLVEQTIGHLHDVVFGEARHLLAVVPARILKRVAHDFFRTGPADQLQALHHLSV